MAYGDDHLIKIIKELVGPGQEYRNDFIRIVLSERGAYYQFPNDPNEFSGVVGHYEHDFLDTEAGLKTIRDVVSRAKQDASVMAETFSILVLYEMYFATSFGYEDVYMLVCDPQISDTDGVVEQGTFRADELPEFYKIKWRRAKSPILPYESGIMFFTRNIGDINMAVRFSSPEYANLDYIPNSRAIH
jgi:hypothetical protein